MRKVVAAAVLLAIFAIGLGAGVIYGSRRAADRASQASAIAAAASAGGKVVALERLRSGDVARTISLLETTLDSDLVTIGLTQGLNDPTVRGVVERVARYREDNPHKSGDAVVDEAVGDLLSKMKPARQKQ